VELVLFSKRNRSISKLSLAATVLLLLEVLKHPQKVPGCTGLGSIFKVELVLFSKRNRSISKLSLLPLCFFSLRFSNTLKRSLA
jgi:hypothetical protein